MREEGAEPFYGSQGYYVGVGAGGMGGQGFGSIGDYIDIGQCKCAGHFPEEGGLLVIRFDQRQVDVRGPNLQRESGESGAGTDVEDVQGMGWDLTYRQVRTRRLVAVRMRARGRPRPTGGEEMPGHKQRLAEVAGYDFFFLADSSQVDTGVPAL